QRLTIDHEARMHAFRSRDVARDGIGRIDRAPRIHHDVVSVMCDLDMTEVRMRVSGSIATVRTCVDDAIPLRRGGSSPDVIPGRGERSDGPGRRARLAL